MTFLDPLFNPLLGGLLNASPFWAIVVISFAISLLISLAHKYLTNQEEMKYLKNQQKEFQKRMKELKSNPEEMMKVQKEAMQSNMLYMKHSFKVSLITMLPIIIIFSWMNAHLAYEPIFPDEKYSLTTQFSPGVTGEAELVIDEGTALLSEGTQKIEGAHATWQLQSTEGEHLLQVKTQNALQSKKVMVTKDLLQNEQPLSVFQDSEIANIKINYNKLRPLGQDFTVPLFNWQPGWLGLYIIFSLVFSLGLRKMLKIY